MTHEQAAAIMRDHAREAARFAGHEGAVLDHSVRSLEVLDQFFCDRLSNGGAHPAPGSPEEEELRGFCLALGGYVGEVIIRHLGGIWVPESDADGEDAILLQFGCVLGSPAESLWQRALSQTSQSPLMTYYRAMHHLLRKAADEVVQEG